MGQTKLLTKLVKPLPKGQITREYEADEIEAFLKEDRLDSKTAKTIRRLLRKTA